jgi:16S rRNA (guanine966-N2)-methyltransferase
MRVIAGQYRSRPLQSLPGMDLRPTADKLRQALFNVLMPGDPEALAGSVWLDLFAGTGAVGIEALSRGANNVYFVEADADAAQLVKQNLQSLGIESGFRIVRQDVARALKALEAEKISTDFVFLDPPYRMENAYRDTLGALSESPLLKPETIVIAEHFKKFDPGELFGTLRRYRKLAQGDAVLSFYRVEQVAAGLTTSIVLEPDV